MKEYYSYLKKGENLSELCKRFDKISQLESLINDLITDNYNELLKYDYLKPNRFENNTELVYKWLSNIPFYIQRIGVSLFNREFELSIRSNNWDKCKDILMITNLNRAGVSRDCLLHSLHSTLPIELKIDIYLTIFNLDKERGLTSEIISNWENTINVNDEPYLVVVLINIYQIFKPKRCFELITNQDNSNIDCPPLEIRPLYISGLTTSILNYFEIYTTSYNLLILKIEYFINWSKSLSTSWLKELLVDIFSMKKMKDVKSRIKEFDKNYFREIESSIIFSETLESEKYKEVMKKKEEKLSFLLETV